MVPAHVASKGLPLLVLSKLQRGVVDPLPMLGQKLTADVTNQVLYFPSESGLDVIIVLLIEGLWMGEEGAPV